MSQTATTPKAEPASDMDRLAAIELEWERYKADYAEDIRSGALDNLPAGKVSGQVEFLVEQAKRAGAKTDRDRERLRSIDREWREYRQFNGKDITADRRVPVAVGKLLRTVAFLAAVARGETPEAEPVYVREDAGPARGPAAGGVVTGASWGWEGGDPGPAHRDRRPARHHPPLLGAPVGQLPVQRHR